MNQTLLTSPMPAKIPRVAVYLDESTKTELEKLASKQRRSLSQMALLLIEEGIEKAKLSEQGS